MNMRQIMAAIVVTSLVAPCIVSGATIINSNKIKIERKEKIDETWTIQSIEINDSTNPAEAGIATNSITLKSSKKEVKKYIIHLSSIDVELNGQPAKFKDLKEGMKVEKFTAGMGQGTITRIVASDSVDDNKADDKKKKTGKKKK